MLYMMALTKGGYQKLSFEERQKIQWPKDSRSNLQINIQKTKYWETILWTETKEDTHYVFMRWTETKEDTHYVLELCPVVAVILNFQ
jgi:hypothetical protein